MTGAAMEPILEVQNLQTHFFTDDGVVQAVDGVDFNVYPGRTLCILGESGCGKSITARSILQIVDHPGKIVGGSIIFRNEQGRTVDIAKTSPRSKAIRDIRGDSISMIFQEPMSSLGPVHTIGKQIAETVRLHRNVTKAEAKTEAIEIMGLVGIPDPETRFDAYPFELSGGLRQRAMIAMALCCSPKLLIADEPTTALDVTTQAQILELIKSLQDRLGMAVMFITHDLGVVAEIADDVAIMYMGQVVEMGDVFTVFDTPKHPYTAALLKSAPRVGMGKADRLPAIEGMVPHPLARPSGCPFRTRCPYARPGLCDIEPPTLQTMPDGTAARCHFAGAFDAR